MSLFGNYYQEIDTEINATIEQLKKDIIVGHCVEVIAPFMI